MNADATALTELGIGSVGTTGSSARPATRRFFGAIMLVGVSAIGTIGIVTPADVAAAQVPFIESNTLPAGVAGTATSDGRAALVPDALRRLRQTSGLNWGQLASALGVSRRTIHHWLAGSRVADVHLARLALLEDLVESAAAGAPEQTRVHLLRPQPSGRSLFDDLVLAAGIRSRPISSVSVADLLGPADGPVVDHSPGSERASSLRGGSLDRRARGGT